MEEKIFYQSNDVIVSNIRFIVNGQTYTMSNVTSVKKNKEEPNKIENILWVFFGLLFLFSGNDTKNGMLALIGISFICTAIYFAVTKETKFSVVLSTSSSEKQALTSENETYINEIVNALNKAIVYRG